jgi:hypothetical protein
MDHHPQVRAVGRAECFKVVQHGLESADKKNANGDAQDGQCRPAWVPDCILQDEPDNLHRGSPVALGASFIARREEKTQHRAHRDHREKYFRPREQGVQGYGSLFIDPQSLPVSLLRDLCGEILLGLRPKAALYDKSRPKPSQRSGHPQRRPLSMRKKIEANQPCKDTIVSWKPSLRIGLESVGQ